MMVGLLAVLKAGGAYLPLDPAHPAERLAFMLADAQPRVLLTQKAVAASLPDSGATLVFLDDDFSDESDENPDSGVQPDTLAYVIYTSGSTGRPKGVMNAHRGIANQLRWMEATYELGAADRLLQKTTCTFDLSLWELFWPLVAGAQVVMARPGFQGDTAYLVNEIRTSAITTMLFVPSMLAVFLDDPASAHCPSLRRVICIGEALPTDLQERFFSVLPGVELHNLYGPTEAAVGVTFWPCKPGSSERIVPIGRPGANTQIHILDTALQPVPIGVGGELMIGGAQVARGYLGREELTAEKFVPNPYGQGRLYKTGDLARYRADGAIEYLGRLDHQVKLRGFRIELGEIEDALRQHPSIRDAAVTLREDAGEKRLAAYCVLRAGTAIGTPESRQTTVSNLTVSLRAKLPDYMLPSIFVFLDALPLSANGKLDRRALPTPDWGQRQPGMEYMAPRNELEERIASIWRQVLKTDRIGVHDDLFAVGGHSLLAIQLLSRLREAFSVDIPARQLFDAPSIAVLAKFIERHAPAPPPARAVHSVFAIHRGDQSKRPLFLVPGGWGGEIEFLAYGRLKTHLGPEQPLYGLRARGADGLEHPHRTVEEMAADYVSEIRTVQPHGPYAIAGECVGGILAYEMARLLESQGEKVDPLIVLDTEQPSKTDARRFQAKERSEKRRLFIESRIRVPAREHWEKMSLLSLGQRVSYIAKRIFRRRRAPSENSHAPDERKLLAHYPVLLMRHPLKPYGGRVTLLVNEALYATENVLGWDKVPTGGLDFHVLPGDHLSYIREHAASAAAKLRELMLSATPKS